MSEEVGEVGDVATARHVGERASRMLTLGVSAVVATVLAVVEAVVRRLPPLRGMLGKRQRVAMAREEFRAQWAAIAGRRPLWCHVASAGELEEAIPILTALRRGDPTMAVVLTCFSASGLAAAAREAGKGPAPWELAGPIELDLPGTARRFVAAVRPSRALFVHRELWPWHLCALEEASVPRALVQIRAERAGLAWKLFASWLRRFDFLGAVDEEGAAAMRALVADAPVAVSALGDARVDRIAARFESVPAAPKESLVLASIWPEDFDTLGSALRAGVVRRRPLIIVPHEPSADFVERILELVTRFQFTVRKPPFDPPLVPGEVEIVDTVGGLLERYAGAAIVFVGGSFRSRVHNVLEPAYAGCALITGPFTDNAPDVRRLARVGGLRRVHTASDFLEVLKGWEDAWNLADAQSAARQYVEGRRGAGEGTARALERALVGKLEGSERVAAEVS